MLGRNIKVVYHVSSPINALLRLESTVIQVKHSITPSSSCHSRPFSDTPTPKFGEALRAQVEERLAFFETGAPPSKNADALRRVVEELALEDDEEDEDAEMEVDEEPMFTTLEPEPPKEKKRKRKHDDMDVDEDDDHSLKKVKLSKEEKKLLKKAKKEKAKADASANGTKDVGYFFLLETFLLKLYFRIRQPARKRTSPQRRRRRKRKKRRKRSTNRPISSLSQSFTCTLRIRPAPCTFLMHEWKNQINHSLTKSANWSKQQKKFLANSFLCAMQFRADIQLYFHPSDSTAVR